jgi:methyl halide transferase
VLGVDISPVGVAAAREYLATQYDSYPLLKSQASVEQLNFFELKDKFDLIYDYTFLCALDPSIRDLWAQQMSDLVRPGGELLTLIYPIGDHTTGPPFSVSLQLFTQLLEPVGFACKRLELLPSELCHPGRDGTGPSMSSSGIGRWIRQ